MASKERSRVTALSAEEIDQEAGTELPDREAMSLLSGDLFNPTMPAEGSDLLGGAGGATGEPAPADGTDLSSVPIPFKNPLA